MSPLKALHSVAVNATGRGLVTALGLGAALAGCGGPEQDELTWQGEETHQVSQALVFNGGFESAPSFSGYLQLSAGSTALPGWSIFDGGVDILNTWQAADGTHCIDLNALSQGRMAQTFNTTAGRRYQVNFSLAGNPNGGAVIKQMSVEAAGQAQTFTFDITGRSTSNMGWVRRSFAFTANASTTTLTFRSLLNDNGGAMIDAVSVIAL